MSVYKFFFPLVLLIFIGCGGDSSTSTDSNPAPLTPAANTPDISTTTTPAAKPAEPAQNAAGVWHYTCPKGCAGGGGSATPCASCGATLAHNQAYHGTPPVTTGLPTTPPPTTNGKAPISPILTNPNAGQTTTQPLTIPPKANEPAQNAAGVWHYTCSAGCSGGAGSAIACASCGKTLVHNQAYH